MLRKWTVKHQIRQIAMPELLKGVEEFGNIDESGLPGDAKTLLQPPRNKLDSISIDLLNLAALDQIFMLFQRYNCHICSR